MMKHLNTRSLLLAAMTVGAPFASQVHAAGFQLNEHSAAGLGRAFAGEAAYGDNAAAIARNPALATRFDSLSISAGVTHVNPEVDAEGEVSYLGGLATANADEEDFAPSAWVPNAYLVQPINDRWSWGLSLNSHFGLSTDFGNDYNGADLADEAEIITYNINPSVAYKLTDTISLGLGLSLVKADATFGTAVPLDVPFPFAPAPIAKGSQILKLEGDDTSWGWNVGATWEATDALRLGLAYRSEVELTLEGDSTSDISPAFNQGGSLDLDLPAGAELSGVYQLTPAWNISASVQWTDWSVFESLEVDFDDGTQQHLKDENFEDNMRYSIGTTYEFNKNWTARLGLAYDESAVSAEYRSLSIPDTDRIWYSAGFTYRYDQHLSVDFAATYLDGEEVDLTETSSLGTTFSGSTHGDAELLSFSINYTF
ncbi:OmpP1/FadL family transporter [Aestuariicella sp. G3-2]|uniref:OmpP1/FadL family transporter n=1 Tax=Pseudomaricurvus albidus TaxID=2842452 RepID=UPI001C0D6C54|nr:outer membrane protein transport protein [Aestuariicella albida]MBU3068509.1 OmpP1/FadL family transporter [Aestuariicella albida]